MRYSAVSLSVPLITLILGLLTPACDANDGELEFKPFRVVRAFPAIKNPPLTKMADLPKDFLQGEELVIGIQIGKEARAYPINMLTGPSREIINDKLGERAIAATW